MKTRKSPGTRSSSRDASPRLPAYRDSSLPPEKRVRDLLKRMTLQEKAAQMVCFWQNKAALVDEQGRFDPEKARPLLGTHGLGQIGRPSDVHRCDPRHMALLTNAMQRFCIENSRLGIPVIFHEECLHGHAATGGTSFPQPIALAGTFNPDLVEALFTMTAHEARSRGAHQALTPVLDVAREPRWGRVEETYGEDPYLVARMGVAAVRGFQGDGAFRDKRRVIATLKHFVAHGQPESGMNCAPANVSARVLHEVFLPSFRAAVVEAGALSVMASYNEVDGVPSHANRWLLRDLLRGQWGFRGFVVSDYFAVWELADRPDTHGHHVATGKKDACRRAVEAGVNIELPDGDCYLHLVDLVKAKQLKESQLDELVAPLLLMKFKLGLFDDPYVEPDHAQRIVGCEQHAGLALRAAWESITLLKNENRTAPLNLGTLRKIAVVGPNAARCMLGGYSGTPPHEVSVLEGIRRKVAGRCEVVFAQGCRITRPPQDDPLPPWYQDRVYPNDPAEDRRLIAEAVEAARDADAIVLCIGGNEQTSREAWNRRHLGDRARLDLPGMQDELIDALAALGKPVIAFLFNGRPLAVTHLLERVPVLFECWYLGQESGHAVADVLFGDYNPSGKLPISFPRSAGHLPVYYNHKPSDRRGYLFDDASPLFAFGYGLSYTTFSLGAPRLGRKRLRQDESTFVRVEVTNTGPVRGDEVVQMYIRDLCSSVTRPVKELKGFQKVRLEPGEKKTVKLPITPQSLAFYDLDMRWVVEPGEFEIMVGTSSRDLDLQRLKLTVIGPPKRPK